MNTTTEGETLFEFIDRCFNPDVSTTLRDIDSYGVMSLQENITLDEHKIRELAMQATYFAKSATLKKILAFKVPNYELMDFGCKRNIIHLATDTGDAATLEAALTIYPKSQVSRIVNSKDAKGWTPLHVAVCNDRVDCAKVLLDSGANQRISLHHNSPPSRGPTRSACIHLAATKGNPKMIKVLIDRVPKCAQEQDEAGRQPLHYCAYNGNIEAMEMLIEAGCDVNLQDDNQRVPLHSCSMKGSVAPTELLLKHNCVLGTRDRWQMSPYKLALSLGHLAVAELIFSPDEQDDKAEIENEIAAGEIAKQLNEPLEYQIKRVVEIMGVKDANKLLQHTLIIEEEGGRKKKDGKRRTPGGIFLQLVEERLSAEDWQIIVRERKEKAKKTRRDKRNRVVEYAVEQANNAFWAGGEEDEFEAVIKKKEEI